MVNWDGQQHLGDRLALAVLDLSTASAPAPLLVAVRADELRCLVRPEHLGAFLRVHREAVIACDDARAVHWVIEEHLNRAGDHEALDILWGYSSSARLADVGLLDQLVAMAEVGIERRLRSLQTLAREYLTTVPPVIAGLREQRDGGVGQPEGKASQSPEKDALAIADAVWGCYLVLNEQAFQAGADAESRHIADERFGVLSLGVQVRGAIALHRASRSRLKLRKGVLEEPSALLECCEEIYLDCSRRLHEDSGARACFQWDPSRPPRIARNDRGHIRSKKDILGEWLRTTLAAQPGLYDIPLQPPRADVDTIALSSAAWGDLIDCHPLLQAWSRLEAAAHVERSLREARRDDGRLRPNYEVLPRLHSVNPNLVQLRELVDRAMQPASDREPHRRPTPDQDPGSMLGVEPPTSLMWTQVEPLPDRPLLVVELLDLDLRCLAETSHLREEPHGLLRLFEADEDPIDSVADKLSQAMLSRAELSPEVEETLNAMPAKSMAFEQIVRAILRIASRGLAARHVANLVSPQTEKIFHFWGTEQIFDYVISEVLPDISDYLQDRTVDILQEKLGCKDNEFMKISMHDKEHASETDHILRDMFRGEMVRPELFEQLRRACRNGAWRTRLAVGRGSPGLFHDLFRRTVTTGTGRVRGRMYFHQAEVADALDLADDVRKIVAYAFVRAGYELVAVAGNQFVLRAPIGKGLGDPELNADHVSSLVESAAGEILGSAPIRCWVEQVKADGTVQERPSSVRSIVHRGRAGRRRRS